MTSWPRCFQIWLAAGMLLLEGMGDARVRVCQHRDIERRQRARWAARAHIKLEETLNIVDGHVCMLSMCDKCQANERNKRSQRERDGACIS